MNNFRADDFDYHDLISFANEWVALGSSIQEQVEYICNVDPEEQDDAEVNENAILHAKRSGIYGVTEEIDDAIDSYLEFQNTIKDAIDEENDDDDDADVMCETTRPNGNKVQLTVPPKKHPVTRSDGRVVHVTVPEKSRLLDVEPEKYIDGIVLDIQTDDGEFFVAYYLDGEFREGPTYYAIDYKDAMDTRQAMKRAAEKTGHRVTLKETMRRINRS